MSRTMESLSKLERRYIRRRVCGFCEVNLSSYRCGGYHGPHTLPIIEGVRNEEETVDLGPPCNMDEKRAMALQYYKPRRVA